jgi:hypothetical protein
MERDILRIVSVLAGLAGFVCLWVISSREPVIVTVHSYAPEPTTGGTLITATGLNNANLYTYHSYRAQPLLEQSYPIGQLQQWLCDPYSTCISEEVATTGFWAALYLLWISFQCTILQAWAPSSAVISFG